MTPSQDSVQDPASGNRLSGNEAVAAAEKVSRHSAERNIPSLPDLPVEAPTANLRQGPDLHPALLALLPLVGVWRGTGEGDSVENGQFRFGQQLVIAHDGRDFLSYSSEIWITRPGGETASGAGTADTAGTNAAGSTGTAAAPAVHESYLKESGYLRITAEDVITLSLTHSSGAIELYYGKPLHDRAWEIATDVVLSPQGGAQLPPGKRLYGLVEGADLGWVEERARGEQGFQPHLSARLQRWAG